MGKGAGERDDRKDLQAKLFYIKQNLIDSTFRDSQAGIFLSRGVLATAKIKDKVVSIMVLYYMVTTNLLRTHEEK